MSDPQQFTFTLEQQEDFAFLIRFDQDIPPLLADEPPPLGHDAGPNPSRLLAASVANCLSASLLFALRKFKNNPGQVTTSVTAHMERNEEKRLRVGSVDVAIQFDSPADSMEHLDRVLDQFEDFCVVTQSVRSGFPVSVTVRDGTGKVLKGG
ncbi:MAG: OsmC family protein [Sulfuritalea sp.]|nr:OsmC family protein [Sulfuritalea sp.]